MFKSKVVLIALAAVVLIGVGGCVGKAPEQVVDKMIRTMAGLDSGHFNADIKIAGRMSDFPGLAGEQEQLSDLTLKIAGDFDSRQDQLKYDSVISIKAKTSSQNIEADLTVRLVDLITYLKINQAPMLGIMDWSSMLNKWYKFEPAAGESAEQQLTARQIASIRQALKNKSYLTVLEDLGETTMNNENTHHYKVKLNKVGIKSLIMEINQITNGQAMTADEISQLDADLAAIKNDQGEVWIGVRDSYLYRITGRADVESNLKQVEIDITLSEFNQTVDIVAPEQAEVFDITAAVGLPAEGDLLPNTPLPGKAFLNDDYQAELEKAMKELEKYNQ